MIKLDSEKIAQLPTINERLEQKYGKHNSELRDAFDCESVAWFYGNMLRERRKELKMTQKQVAEQLGREQSYSARIESGKTDLQLSSFLRIAAVLGMQFIPSFG